MVQQYGEGGGITVTMEGPFGGGGGSVTTKTTNITLPASAWKGAESPFSQVVDVDKVSINSQVNLQLSDEQLKNFPYAFTAVNEGGVVTVYSIGDKPIIDYTIQATILEVVTSGGGNAKIIGNTVGTTMPRTNWEQTDSTKADYLKGRDVLEMLIQTAQNTANSANNAAANAKTAADRAHTAANNAQKTADGKVSKENVTITLPRSNWSSNNQTVSVSGVTTDNDVFVSAAPASYIEYAECMIRCTTQENGKLTFSCSEVPTGDIYVNVIIFN